MVNLNQVTDDLITLYKKLLVPFMKIRRDMPFPAEAHRAETDGEHAFTLAMVALSLNEKLELNFDHAKISKYALVHDLVEVHAGDVSVKASHSDHESKEQREKEALEVIKQDFSSSFPWIHQTIEAYEAREDDESKFVYVTDKILGALGWLAGDGKGWQTYYPKDRPDLYALAYNRLRTKVVAMNDERMLELFDFIHQELERNIETWQK